MRKGCCQAAPRLWSAGRSAPPRCSSDTEVSVLLVPGLERSRGFVFGLIHRAGLFVLKSAQLPFKILKDTGGQ